MEDIRQQQIEVLREAAPYCEKLEGAIEKVSDELVGVSFPETHDAVDVIIEGLNWLFEVYNGTKSLINADGSAVDENETNAGVAELQAAISSNDDAAISKGLVRLGTFVRQLREAALKYID